MAKFALLAAAAAALAGSPSPESVARAWSKALNVGDDEAAARLFAEGAVILAEGAA